MTVSFLAAELGIRTLQKPPLAVFAGVASATSQSGLRLIRQRNKKDHPKGWSFSFGCGTRNLNLGFAPRRYESNLVLAQNL